MNFVEGFIQGQNQADQRKARRDAMNLNVANLLAHTQDPQMRKSLSDSFLAGGYLKRDGYGRAVFAPDGVEDDPDAENFDTFVRDANSYVEDVRGGRREADDDFFNTFFRNRDAAQKAEKESMKYQKGSPEYDKAMQGKEAYTKQLGQVRTNPSKYGSKRKPTPILDGLFGKE